MNDAKKNPLDQPGYFENPPEVRSVDPPSRDLEPPKKLTMKGFLLEFAFDLLRLLNMHKLAQRQGMPIPTSFRAGLSPEKVVTVVEFIIDLDIELFSRHDFYNENISLRTSVLAGFNGAFRDSDFEVEELVESFIPEEFSDEAKARVRSLHMRILAAIASGRIKREDVMEDA